MKRNGKVYMIAGVVLALVAGVMLFLFLSQMESGTKQPTPTPVPDVDVVILSRDVKAGTILTGEMIERRTRKMNDPSVTPETVRDLSEAVDRMVVSDAKVGQMLRRGDLQALPFVLPKGKKAMALLVDDLSAVAGLVRERDYIDVVISGKIKLVSPEERTGQKPASKPAAKPQPSSGNPEEDTEYAAIQPVGDQTVVKAVLQRVQVLKVVAPPPPTTTTGQAQGQPTPAVTPSPTPSTMAPQGRITNAKTIIVLAVTDQEAELIRFANDTGSFQIVLRARDDNDREETKGMTLDILIRDFGVPIPRPVVVDIKPEQ